MFFQLLNQVQLFATPWTAAHQASLSFTVSQSLLKLISMESVMLFDLHNVSESTKPCRQDIPILPISTQVYWIWFVTDHRERESNNWALVIQLYSFKNKHVLQDPVGSCGKLNPMTLCPCALTIKRNSVLHIFFLLHLHLPVNCRWNPW